MTLQRQLPQNLMNNRKKCFFPNNPPHYWLLVGGEKCRKQISTTYMFYWMLGNASGLLYSSSVKNVNWFHFREVCGTIDCFFYQTYFFTFQRLLYITFIYLNKAHFWHCKCPSLLVNLYSLSALLLMKKQLITFLFILIDTKMILITLTSLQVSIVLIWSWKWTPFKSLVHEENTFTNKKNLMQFLSTILSCKSVLFVFLFIVNKFLKKRKCALKKKNSQRHFPAVIFLLLFVILTLFRFSLQPKHLQQIIVVSLVIDNNIVYFQI